MHGGCSLSPSLKSDSPWKGRVLAGCVWDAAMGLTGNGAAFVSCNGIPQLVSDHWNCVHMHTSMFLFLTYKKVTHACKHACKKDTQTLLRRVEFSFQSVPLTTAQKAKHF